MNFNWRLLNNARKALRLKLAVLDSKVMDRLLRRLETVGVDNGSRFTMRNFGYSTKMRSDTFLTKEPEMIDWIKTWSNQSVFLDVGASTGVYSLFAAAKGHRVMALEPSSLNFAILNLNIIDNNFQDVISAYPVCADDSLSISELNFSSLDWGAGSNTYGRSYDWMGNPFEAVFRQGSIGATIDWILTQGHPAPNFVKIDVDGNELRVLRGALGTLRRPDCLGVYIELYEKHPDFAECLEILKACGFRLDWSGQSSMFEKNSHNSQNYIFSKN